MVPEHKTSAFIASIKKVAGLSTAQELEHRLDLPVRGPTAEVQLEILSSMRKVAESVPEPNFDTANGNARAGHKPILNAVCETARAFVATDTWLQMRKCDQESGQGGRHVSSLLLR